MREDINGDDDHEEDDDEVDEKGNKNTKASQDYLSEGKTFYGAFHVLIYTGLYRLLPTRAFQHELAICYFQELIFSMLPMFLI